jgi:peptidoglycan/LPS O-acetylase OafA/YrhL
MQYRREIDGLRALAVIPVILYHAGFQTLSGGFVGVDIFFVISGYLICSILLAELEAEQFSILRFYERRARRILPALFFVIFLCMPFAWVLLLPSDLKEFADSVVAVSFFSSNFLFWKNINYFDTATELKPLLHTWSLAVEEQFYLFFPVFLRLMWPVGKLRIVLILCGVAALSLAAAQWGSISKPGQSFYLLPTRAWELVLGALIAFYFAGARGVKRQGFVCETGGAVGLLLLTYSFTQFDNTTPIPSVYALVPTMGAALIILCTSEHTIIGKLLGSKPLVGIGLVSYSAYLWHQPVLVFSRHQMGGGPSQAILASLAVLSLVLGFLTWKYIEKPFRKPNQYSSLQVFKLGGALGAFLIFFGVAGNLTTGFIFRYDEKDQQLAALSKAEAGKYVLRRFEERQAKAFDINDRRRKVLIVGDSFGQDLVNALYEADLSKSLQFSTRHVSALCGNLFLTFADFSNQIGKSDLPLCQKTRLFDDAQLRATMMIADEVWFASKWTSWQAQLVPQSVANIQSLTLRPVKVFSTKSLGKVDVKALLMLSQPERLKELGSVDARVVETNKLLELGLPPETFINIQKMLCGGHETECHHFVERYGLVSYDGSHLTKAGASLLGEQLSKIEYFRSLATN